MIFHSFYSIICSRAEINKDDYVFLLEVHLNDS
ncbi:hypothetical protein CbuK_0661 [Coxiella burnetii CbuK_Q154]|nr:hypothetical protein CbuK_0661 [Coxiella burnetii CbuK_Q154]